MPDIPNATLAEFFRASIDFETDTLRVALISDATAYTFDPDNHDTVADVLDGGTTAQELNGSSGYTGSSDRVTLQNVSVTVDDTDDEGVFDCDDPEWSNVESTNQIQGYLIYQQVGGDDTTPGDDPLIYVADDDMAGESDLPLPTNGSGIRLSIDTEGLINNNAA